MSKDKALFNISVLAEQAKNLIGTVEETGDTGRDAILFITVDYLHRIQAMAESLEMV